MSHQHKKHNLKIVSGGQTGVDRAALDVAIELGLECGGWCPKGRRAEDGPILAKYPLVKTPTSEYSQRTEWNVRDSDGTLILYRERLFGGTELTMELAQKLHKPFLLVDIAKAAKAELVQDWIENNNFKILNVAGPGEESEPGIYHSAQEVLRTIFLKPHGG